MTSKIIFFILLSTLFSLWSCHKETVPQIEIVARIKDQYLTREELSNWLPPKLPEDQKEKIASQYINQWIQRTALSITAEEEGLSLSEYEQWSMRNLEKEMLAQKYLTQKLPDQIAVTDEEIAKYYKENKEEFKRGQEEVHLVQLFLENPDPAINREIRTSKSLLQVIKNNFLDTRSDRMLEKNGDLGYISPNSLTATIKRRVTSGTTGKIYGPIKLEKGQYYFQALDKQAAGSYRSLKLVKEDIRMRLLLEKRENLIKEIARETMKNLKVETYPEHFK